MFRLSFLILLLPVPSFAYYQGNYNQVHSYQNANAIAQQGDVHNVQYRQNAAQRQEIRTSNINGFIPSQKVVARQHGYSQVAVNDSYSIKSGASYGSTGVRKMTYPMWSNPDFLYIDRFYVVRSDWQTIKGFFHEKWRDVANSYQSVCKVMQNKPDNFPVKSQSLQIGTAGDLKKICMELALLHGKSDAEYQWYFARNFVPYLVGDDDTHTNMGTFTGYYYPTLNASRVRTHKYKYPIYKKPPELSGQPYYTRKQINDGALNGRGLEIFWVDDFVDLYFLHIQGSGMLKLTDGTYAHVKFAAKNNQPYESLGKYMLAQKYIKKGSDTKSFLQANENIAHDILSVNKSYIFFAENHQQSVIGAHGSELVDGRSLAVDSQFIPYSTMLFVDSKNAGRVMFAQDTGSAIKGKIRGDIFVGKGEEAGEIAKTIHQNGVMYILVHRGQRLSVVW